MLYRKMLFAGRKSCCYKKMEFGKGDFVTFPKDLSCIWDIREPVKNTIISDSDDVKIKKSC